MPSRVLNLETRIKTLNAVLTQTKQRKAVSSALRAANGDMPAALASLTDKLPAASLKNVALAHSLADWSDDNVPVVKALTRQPGLTNLRDVALRFNVEKLAAVVDAEAVPENTAGTTADQKRTNFAVALRRKLFSAEPTAVVQRMVHDAEVPIADSHLRTGIGSFLSNQPDFNIRTTSVYTALKHPDAFKGIPEEHQSGVVEHLKMLQRVQAISPVPEAIPWLMKANLTSAFRVAELPESTFLNAFAKTLGEETARQVHANSINTHIRNEHALITIRESMRGTGLAIIDGGQSREARVATLQAVADQKAVPLNLETLFGSMDYCECDDCSSVYSPAAYFVDILQFLRNNDLGTDPTTGDPKPSDNKNIHPGISNTPLEKLFRRRPDLGCLELTCENTFTVLPYIDLVNEVMESFIVHLDKYQTDTNVPKQATLEVFNVEDETSSELLAQPQHMNYQAYNVLANAVFPFTLPYHQPIDTIRSFLKYLGTSRHELLDTFRITETKPDALTAEQQQQLDAYNAMVDRAVDAEFLGITREEYVILTREAFLPKAYSDLSEDEYRNKIGGKLPHEYYGYKTEADMLSIDEDPTTGQKGLTFVKKQFLPRTGIQYVDLVELLKTRFINPAYPQGKALTILESIRFSYRFLQTLVDTSKRERKGRFAKLIDFLNDTQPLIIAIEALLHLDLCHQQNPGSYYLQTEDLEDWVYCYFERIAKLIVLESGEGPQLPVEGKLFGKDGKKPVGTLHKDGTITDTDGVVIGNVLTTITTIDNAFVVVAGPVSLKDGKAFKREFGTDSLRLYDRGGELRGSVDAEGVRGDAHSRFRPLTWLPARDTCDLEKVRLTHLDGTALTSPEYDRIQRFIRLWRKLGWTIDETDQALIGVSALSAKPREEATGAMQQAGGWLSDGKAPGEWLMDGSGQGGDGKCPDIPEVPEDISPEFLHQLVAVRKLLDLTGLPLDKLLTFWADISTAGEKSLYARLFLTHNILGIDKIFEPDTNGNFLTQGDKLSDHLPGLKAALKLKADDVTAFMKFQPPPEDALTLSGVSVLYRRSLLAKLLHVQVADLPEVFKVFGYHPFNSAQDALALLQDWGHMEDAGFTFRQLDYIICDHDDPKRPLAPSDRKILQITKTLYDGLTGIDHDHPDILPDKDKATPEEKAIAKDKATTDVVRANAGLLFSQSVVEIIVGFLEGTTVYTTNAPVNLTITIPAALAAKLKYSQTDSSQAALQVTGILTDEEIKQAKGLSSSDPNWATAIDRVGTQALNLFNDVLLSIFPDTKEATADAKANLLVGDVNIPPDPENPSATGTNTAPAKRLYFLQYFLPFLRQRLAHRLIVDTLSGAAGLASDVTDLLLSDILKVEASEPAISALAKIKDPPAVDPANWKGYLIPSADDAYTFIATSDQRPNPLAIDGLPVPFPYRRDDPNNIWSTDAVPLKAGKLYLLVTTGLSIGTLQWKTATSPFIPATPPKSLIPASALLPDYSSNGTKDAFVSLYKAALLVNGFNLSADEVSYWQEHATDFDGFDFNAVTSQHWRRLQAYASLRDKLPKSDTGLLDLFKWASINPDPKDLGARIAAVTLWKQDDIEKLIAPWHLDLVDQPEAFCNEVNLVKLQTALTIANTTGADIDLLFLWVLAVSDFDVCAKIAESIRATLRSRYDQSDWEQVIKPLNDQLRENQKQALISYLLVQQDLIDWGVVDADSLFEFFLIDVQMSACMETSRIKQAISSVQLFVQRCMLGLEDRLDQNGTQIGVSNNALDRDRWDWMQKYRVWEANRKVFLYPENWIRPELRDDKSCFYKELESELLQRDINTQTVEDALKSYLFKVDEVANLQVVGLFLQQSTDKDGHFPTGEPVYIKLHVFARTRNAPYFFYYRYFQVAEGNWYPWEKVQVDIPSYDLEDVYGHTTKTGTYLIPVVWRKRLLVFFPQLVKKTKAAHPKTIGTTKPGEIQIPVQAPSEFWEIKMGWSEYRNGKWTQKQVSTEAIYGKSFDIDGYSLPGDINAYRFSPRIVTGPDSRAVIEVFWVMNDNNSFYVGLFHFAGSQVFVNDLSEPPQLVGRTDFQVNSNDQTIHSLQAVDGEDPRPLMNSAPYFKGNGVTTFTGIDGTSENFHHPFAHELLGALATGSLDALFDYYLNKIPNDSPTVPGKVDAFGGAQLVVYHELRRAYSLYNWEAAFHAPMLVVDRLLAARQFAQALAMCHHILNPYAKGADAKRFWQFLPFKEIDAENVLEKLFLGLQPKQPDTNGGINEWRDNPFEPHVIARSRPSAYMKWVAMKYIEILIAYGDYYFRQNTLETIPLASQCYVLASHVYGPRGQKIPKRGKTLPQTYNSLLDKWDAFSNAMVELELVFPFSNQIPLPLGGGNGVVGLANVFGFATTLYFCIPDNPQLRALRDTIDDRLFKIRHCEDIEGVFRQLPLFEPPIEPGLLVEAAAQGLSLSSVLNDLSSPMPNYRFNHLLQKALELCSELKGLGNTFLSAKEKGDAEALSQLRATHESSIHKLLMEVKKQQLDESGKALEALEQSRKAPVYRLQHYLKLLGEDLGKVPDGDTDFAELPDQIEQPLDESGLKLIHYEKEEMDKASAAADWQTGIGALESLASIFHALPIMSADVHPLGVGADVNWGMPNLGNATQGTARALRIFADHLSYQSSSAARKGGFLRQLQDRVQQANVAGYEIKNIDKQILTHKIRIDIANQEITNQQRQIDNARDVEDFLRSKYSNQELYSWMEGQIRTLYYQAYTLAYDLAKRAEKVFRFERGLDTSNFIQFGYWDAARDGLLAGERLYLGLKQLEAEYQENRGYDFEISASFSLRQINPLALMQLRETGRCEFSLPEVLFDMSRPGDYMRRIKSVALTIPCIVGPYTGLNCTLRLLEHEFRTSAVGDYPRKTDEDDDRFSTVNIPITSIATSTGQNDSGVFELNFRDERYLPFEGAGAISKWRLELPAALRQFDYDSITDVIIHLRYTAVDGGTKLQQAASGFVTKYLQSVDELSGDEGLFAAFDLRHDFPDAWYKATQVAAGATERVMAIDNLLDRLPIFTQGRAPDKIQATDVYLFAPSGLTAASLTTPDLESLPFTGKPLMGTLKPFVAAVDTSLVAWQLKTTTDSNTPLDKLWMVVRYVLKP